MDKSRTNPDGRPRLLILATLAEAGGVVTYLRNLLPALGGFEITVAAYGSGPLQAAVEEAGGRYVALRYVRRPPHPLRDLAGLVELVRLLRQVRPHVLHANSSKAGVLGRLAAAACRVPIRIFTVHGWAFAWIRPRFLYLWPDRLMRPLTTMTICVAESARKLGVSARACDPERTIVIPNGILLPPRKSARDLHAADPVVVSVGRLAPPKDFGTLIEALAFVEAPLRLQIVGDGPDREALGALIGAAGCTGRVEILGERADVPHVLAAADVFALATTSEAMPMSILEAMAASLPVVASAVGGIPELVVDGETGYLVRPRDARALGEALETLLREPGDRERMGRAGRDRAEELYGVELMQRRHLDLYSQLLAERGLPQPAGGSTG